MTSIHRERLRQIEEEGWDEKRDDMHTPDEFMFAGYAYLCNDEELWPWDQESFKPRSRAENLKRAGALFLAGSDWFQRRARKVLQQLNEECSE
jgi:hypothetical protein